MPVSADESVFAELGPAEQSPPGFETQRLRASLSARLFGRESQQPLRVGRFVVVDLIGSGGMGTVYAAYDPVLDRKVAVKLLRGSQSEKARARLLREAQAMARVSHPNVVTVHEVGTFESHVFVAMEFVHGTTLQGWCRQHPPESRSRFDTLVELAVQAIRGLIAAHDAGLVHRDVKPSNMLVGEDGRLRMADFGLARQAPAFDTSSVDVLTDSYPSREDVRPHDVDETLGDVSAEASGSERPFRSDGAGSPAPFDPMTGTGELLGTPAYMAPEHLDGRVDARSDQFSLCLALWEATYGERPFESTALVARLEAIAAGPSMPAGREEVPRWWLAVLRRGLAYDPAERFPSMTALLEAIDSHRSGKRSLGPVGLAVLVGGLALGGWLLRPTSAAAPCRVDGELLEAAWGSTRRAQLDAALELTGDRASHKTRIEAVLDRFAVRWLDGVKSACEGLVTTGDLVAGIPVLEQAGARMQCLREARAQLDVLAESMIDEARTSPAGALTLIHALPDPRQCSDRAGTGLDGEQRREHALAIARASALTDVRRLEAAEAEVRPVLDAAERTGDQLIISRVRSILSRVHNRRDEHERSMDEARAALAAAERSGDPEQALAAWQRVFSAAVSLKKFDDADFHLERMHAHADALGPSVHFEYAIAHAEAELAHARGEWAQAAERGRAAAELVESLFGPEHPRLADALEDLASILDGAGEPTPATEMARRALAINLAAFGEDHVRTARSLAVLGLHLGNQGARSEAVEVLSRATAVLRTAADAAPHERYVAWFSYAQELAGIGRVEDAERELDSLAATAKAAGHHPFLDYEQQTRAGILLDHGRTREAAEIYERLRASPANPGGRHNLNAIEVNLAVAWARLGRLEDAGLLAKKAETELREIFEPGSARLVSALGWIAEVYRLTGDLAKSRSVYEECLSGYSSFGADNIEVARARLGYALTLRALDEHDEALAQARRARPLLERDGFPSERAALVELLAAH